MPTYLKLDSAEGARKASSLEIGLKIPGQGLMLLCLLSLNSCLARPPAAEFQAQRPEERNSADVDVEQRIVAAWTQVARGRRPKFKDPEKRKSFLFLLSNAERALKAGDGQRAEEYLLSLQQIGIERSTLLPGLLSACILNARFSQALVYLNDSPQRFQDTRLLYLAVTLEVALKKYVAALRDAHLLLKLEPSERSLALYVKTAEGALPQGKGLYRHYLWAAGLTSVPLQAEAWLRKAAHLGNHADESLAL